MKVVGCLKELGGEIKSVNENYFKNYFSHSLLEKFM